MHISRLSIGFILLGWVLSACARPATDQPLTGLVGRGYSGRLVLIDMTPSKGGNRVLGLDLSSGEFHLIFQAPKGSWLTAAVASPDGTQLLLAYAPPGSGAAALNYNTDLYLVPMDGSSPPRPLVSRQDPGTQSYFNPQWAPDGRSIYATFLYQITPTAADPSPYQNDIVQISLQGAQKVLIHQHALWPRLSPDGARMAYLYVDPQSLSNDLYLARADGTQPVPLLQPGSATPIDDHLFTPDGSQVIFSMVNGSGPSKGSWFERWLGVTVASAHNVPSDWYRMPAAGGEPQRITRLNDTGMYAALAPDGKHMAFISSAGLYLMNLDGSDLYQVTRQTFIGTIDWIK